MIEIYLMKLIMLIAGIVISVMAKELKQSSFSSTTTATVNDIQSETNEGDDRNLRLVKFTGARDSVTGGTGTIRNQLSKETTFVDGVVQLTRDPVMEAVWEANFELAGTINGGQGSETWAFEPGQMPWRNGETLRHHLVSGITGGTQTNTWMIFWEDAVGKS